MSVFFGGRKIEALSFGGRAISEAYYGAKLVYAARSSIKGFEAFFDTLDRDGYSYELDLPATKVVTTNVSSTTTNFHIHVLCGDDASIVVEQSSGGRKALDLRVSGGKVSVKSTGDRGKSNLSFSGDWPGGVHILSVSTDKEWYGYQMKVLVDGKEIASQSNGGGFTLSENLLSSGEVKTTLKGCLARQPLATRRLLSNSSSSVGWIVEAVKPGAVVWWTLPGKLPSLPGARMKGALYGGGSGGAGGATSISGKSGSGGTSVFTPELSIDDLKTLVVGSGGPGGGRGTLATEPGKEGDPSYITVAGKRVSSESNERFTPTIFGSKYSGSLPGAGGSGGDSSPRSKDDSSFDLFGKPGSPGKPGGLLLARTWDPSPPRHSLEDAPRDNAPLPPPPPSSGVFRGDFELDVLYRVGDTVKVSDQHASANGTYECLMEHTSNVYDYPWNSTRRWKKIS
ncbi:hypothetical protein [Corynebacterium urealyticum]|uniref:Uncharacterized protein n=1 Tax=Corynebacterium urealyticum (strain ATCC 43042 / DSM 7109) TaxID=504474 RepID=B1VGT4_CORU7|nr:hypothetical protein [Corynebacterium urealyticum]QQC41214.1 hypothetical protein I6H51_05550 [Corynebacterium urealyticum]CAQ05391.1 hypothetical protein cu1431 [Corynebacterium urealyticum DSM 7109]SNV88251.1 Uncharacterised protein [Corynebacterium urealyticum]